MWSWIGPKMPPGSKVTIRIRSWCPAMPSISRARSTVASTFTATPLVSGACSLLIVLSSLYAQVGIVLSIRGEEPLTLVESRRVAHPLTEEYYLFRRFGPFQRPAVWSRPAQIRSHASGEGGPMDRADGDR